VQNGSLPETAVAPGQYLAARHNLREFAGEFLATLDRGRMRILGLEFSAAIQAHPVRPVSNGKHATHVTMMAPKGKLENPKQWVHRSSLRLR
jgi:hypothetical protein